MDKEKVLDYLNKNIKDGEYELAMRTNTYNTRMYMELLPFIKKMKKEIVVGTFDKE